MKYRVRNILLPALLSLAAIFCDPRVAVGVAHDLAALSDCDIDAESSEKLEESDDALKVAQRRKGTREQAELIVRSAALPVRLGVPRREEFRFPTAPRHPARSASVFSRINPPLQS